MMCLYKEEYFCIWKLLSLFRYKAYMQPSILGEANFTFLQVSGKQKFFLGMYMWNSSSMV